MNFQENEKLFSSKLFLYLSRILILYTFSVIFKSFDHTFTTGLQIMDLRSQMFSLLYVLFGLAAWEGAAWLARTVERRTMNKHTSRKLVFLCASLLVLSLIHI